ncbi:glutaredoxin domain-containing protein [Ditylenchus destructor]|nr:glutaredoxin domain-containing protein [Ditylenchus destructor]
MSDNEISPVHEFLQKYGWYVLTVIIFLLYVYYKFVKPRVDSVRMQAQLRRQKKFDEDLAAAHHADIERARQLLHEQYLEQAREAQLKEEERRRRKQEEQALEAEKASRLEHRAVAAPKPAPNVVEPRDFIHAKVQSKAVVIFCKSWCAFSRRARQALSRFRLKDENYLIIELDEWKSEKQAEKVQSELRSLTGNTSSPWVFINGKYIGSADETVAACRNGTVEDWLRDANVAFFS